MRSILDDLKERHLYPGQMEIIISILQVYNCRAAEVLGATWDNFFPDNYLILDGCKNSANVIVRDREILKCINALPRIDPVRIFYQVNYFRLYYHCKSRYAHLFLRFKGKKNFKVTHGFRFAAVESVNNEFYIRDILAHRSVKSGRFYKPKKKGLNNAKK